MILLKIFLVVQAVMGSTPSEQTQDSIDSAFALIFESSLGQAICSQILGADAEAVTVHLGVSKAAALKFAQECKPTINHWVTYTPATEIRKLVGPNPTRRYVFVKVEAAYPIESWTDPFTNTTLIFAQHLPVTQSRLVQILAHETAVYFDSKANPAHPEARLIPELRDLQLESSARLNPLVAVSNPLNAHTLTYLRALQIEFAVVRELVAKKLITPPKDFADPYLNHLISERCEQTCLEELISNMRETYLPMGLTLLAFAPQYRALMNRELPRMQRYWTDDQWARAQSALNILPAAYLKEHFSQDLLVDLKDMFNPSESDTAATATVSVFLKDDVWPMEWLSLTSARTGTGSSFLEFMKAPLLSGYNILLSSGPRARVRTGNVE